MIMAFGGFERTEGGSPMSEINIIPLVDVMLVLLVIFIITTPLLTHAVKIDLPKTSSNPNLTKPENIHFTIDADGGLYWNGESIERSEMTVRMRAAGAQRPVPELHLHADREARYGVLADVLAEASKSGLTRIGFVSQPERSRAP
jgi:biopolymer transport protein ExbD